jgi:hypothetical protein
VRARAAIAVAAARDGGHAAGMRGLGVAAATGALVLAAAGSVRAGALGDTCTVSAPVDFAVGVADLDLDAVSRLADAANWARIAPGRFLLVVTPPDDALGVARAQSAASYLVGLGVDPRAVGLSNLDALGGLERHIYAGPDAVVVLTCLGILPYGVSAPYLGYPIPPPIAPPAPAFAPAPSASVE